jgi:hypothetical protein
MQGHSEKVIFNPLKEVVLAVDTQLVSMGVETASGSGNEKAGDSFISSPPPIIQAPAFRVDTVTMNSASAPITYQVINVPSKDTTIIPANTNALQFRKNELFLSSKIFENNILVETEAFNMIASLIN